MTARIPAAEVAIAILQPATAGDRHFAARSHDTPLQCHRRHGQLPRRSRRIPRLNGAIEQRMRGALVERAPVRRRDASHEGVGIESGRAIEREHFSGVRIQRDYSAALAAGKDLRDEALQIEVDGRVQIFAGHGIQVCGRFGVPHHLALGADLHEAEAFGASQGIVVLELQAVFAHQTAEPHGRKPGRGALRLSDLADVADQMRDDRRIGIEALWLGLNEQARNGDAALFEGGHHRERRISENERRLIRCPSRALQHPFNFRAIDVRDRRNARKRRAEVRFRSRQQGHRVARNVLGEHASIAVVDDAAGCRQWNRAQAVGLRLQLVLAMAEDLSAEERQYEDAQHEPHGGARHAQTPIEQMGMECAHAVLRRGDSQPRKNHNTPTPTIAVVRPCKGDHTSSSHATWELCNRPETSKTMRLRSHVPAKKRQPLTNTCSAKNTAFAQDEKNPTSVCANAPAPKLAGVSASRSSPTKNPTAALRPGSARIV